jgi:NADH:ubiquinone oxidoreductase subunit H
MNGSGWIGLLARAATWLLAFLILMVGRQRLEWWLIARFQRRLRRGMSPLVWPLATTHDGSSGNATIQILAMVTALLAGAAIPLAAETQVRNWSLSFHLFGNTDAGLLFVVAMECISVCLLAFAARETDRPFDRAPVRDFAGRLLLAFVPITAIALSLVMTAGLLDAQREGSLSLTTLIEVQGGWRGLRWLGIFQPLALLLWLICAAPVRPAAQAGATLAHQAESLNRTLLTGVLFLGGWQGPFAEQFVWLGLVYTAIKASIVTVLWVWVRSSMPMAHLTAHARAVWKVYAPLAAINLLLTVGIVAVL